MRKHSWQIRVHTDSRADMYRSTAHVDMYRSTALLRLLVALPPAEWGRVQHELVPQA